MTVDGVLAVIEQAPAVAALRNSTYAYPLVNALHVIGVALLFGAIVPLDLRLMGQRRDTVAVDGLAALLLPVAITGFVLAALAGAALFVTDARAYAGSTLFRMKMVLIALALANALALRRTDWSDPAPRRSVALAAATSIILWLAVIVLGRLLGYFEA